MCLLIYCKLYIIISVGKDNTSIMFRIKEKRIPIPCSSHSVFATKF